MATVTDLEGLPPSEKRKLLAALLQKQVGAQSFPSNATAIAAHSSRFDPFPLTEVQKAYWLGRSGVFELGNVSCHVYLEFDVERLDQKRLQIAWQRLIDRHDMLRAIVRADGQQQVLKELPPYLIEELDLRDYPAAEADVQLETVRRRMSHQVLPADRWPLFELRTSRLDDQRRRVHVSIDLLILDFWSIQILMKEWFQLYVDPRTQLPRLEITFRDYVLTVANLRNSPRHVRAEQYWRQQVDTLPPPPELPLVRSEVSGSPSLFVRRRAVLDAGKWQRLKDRGRKIGITPSGVLLAAFAEVLGSWSRNQRFTINLTLFQRLPVHPQVNQIVGDFTSIALLEIDRTKQTLFEETARHLQAQLWRDLEHTEYSGLRVLQDLARSRGGGYSGMPVVFTSALVFDTSGLKPPDGSLPGNLVYSISQTPQVWLDHQVYEQGGGLYFSWDAVEELFPAGLLDEMFASYCEYLERLAVNEGAWKAVSRRLVPAGQLEVRAGVNETSGPVAEGRLQDSFLEQARQAPERTAVVGGGRRLSYGELKRQSSYWGRRLQELGACANELVAVVMEKGWEQVVAVLGILQSGAAYLPIDPELPRERRWRLLEQGGVKLALTQSWLEERLEWPGELKRLSVDEEEMSEWDEPVVAAGPGAGDLAYVIYTSGSTGVPKGVMIDHRGALNTIVDINERFGVGPEDRLLSLSSLSFDLSVYDIFGVLGAGATIVMPEAGRRQDPAHWMELMVAEGVTVWNTVPALLEMLVEYAGGRSEVFPPSLRLALLSGDWIPLKLVEQVRRLAPGVELISLGGATEASIWSILYRIGEVKPGWKSIPYGQPMRNQQWHVLDEAMDPCPTWVPGQLYIGGLGVAQGYWQAEELTAAQFVRHPQTGERMYRTGDLGRYLPDGNIEFLGREDYQVKVQGYRIELGEIEAALEQHAGVRAAVVKVSGERDGPKQLVGYVVAPEVTPAELAHHLRAKLPEYMVPRLWQKLDSLPLTANGKVDRQSLSDLPAPDHDGHASSLPTTVIESALAELWATALGVEAVEVEHNFFDLGGDSLTAVRLLTFIRERFQVEIPIRALFEGQTVRAVAAAIESGLKQQGLESVADFPALPQVVPDPDRRTEPFPLTEIQQAYWIGRSAAFELGNIAAHFYLELEGDDFDGRRLAAAWQRLIERHAMLRTIILENGLQQVLEPAPKYEIEILDLEGFDPAEASKQLGAIRERMSHQVLPVDRWPLFEIRLTRIGPRKSRLHLSIDLLVVDVWSFRLLLLECFALYQNPNAELPALELNFADYVRAVSQLEQTEIWRRSFEYWSARLANLPSAPDLPLARSPASLSQPRFTRRFQRLSKENWQLIKDRARAEKLTPSGVLLAAFAEVLGSWSRNQRFTINLTLFQRLPVHPQVNQIVGDFTSITLLEVDHARKESFLERAQRLQKQLWNDLDHRYVGGVRVMRELARIRGSGPRAMMSVVFTSALGHGIPGQEMLEELSAANVGEVVYSISQTPQVWLDHQVYEQGGGLYFSWDAVEELFPAGLLDEMFASYCEYLERLAVNEGAWKAVSRRLVPAGQLEVRAGVNETSGPVAEGRLQDSFLEQARQAPERTAVVGGGRRLSYGELKRQSSYWGRRLQELGACANELVAVVMEKGWEQVVAVLGILQSGAAYLPIDPELPRERRWRLLEQGGVKLALTQSWLEERLEWPGELKRLSVDEEEMSEWDEPVVAAGPGAGDLAYVIYTSGSTGVPKGVMIDHRGALNTIVDINERFGVGPEDRLLSLSSLSFDLSVYDIFGVLGAGATIVMPEAGRRQDPAHWMELMVAEGVTVWNTVPALLEMLVEYAGGRSEVFPPSLRLALLSGDWIPLKLVEQVRRLAPGVELISLGGATEASIWSILYRIGEVKPGWKSIPYGQPMRNQQWHVLDEAMDPCPTWVPGQLYIGGLGVAQGYWQAEELTAAQFVRHPQTGERMYRTGDLGRYLPDGNIEFLGREDYQVKVQGYRIELGEIEAALEQHAGVRAAVVKVSGERDGPKQLVGYVVAPEVTPAELAHHLRAKLPEYMVPRLWQKLDSLPLTANGKVDRQALQAPEATAREYTAPRNPLEDRLAALWSVVLGVDRVGVYDNFAQLGGDSLLAIQVIARANEAGISITPRQMFEHPTIAELALVASAPSPVKADVVRPLGVVPLTPIQHWFFEQNLPNLHHWNLALLFAIQVPVDISLLESAFRQTLKHHDSFRLRFEQTSSGWRQYYSASEYPFSISRVDLSHLREPEQTAAMERAIAGMHGALNLAEGPVVRVSAFDLDGRHPDRLLVIVHHLVADVFSLRILLEDVQTAFVQLLSGMPVKLHANSASYQDWARQLERYAQSPELEEQIAYWNNCLPADPPLIPVDYPTGQNTEDSARQVRVVLDAEDTKTLFRRLATTDDLKLQEILLSTLLWTITSWSGERSMLVDVAGHGREEVLPGVDPSRIVGWCSSTFPLHLVLPDDESPAQILAAVKRQVRAVPARGIGFGVLRYLLNNDPRTLKLRTLPRARVTFNHLGQIGDTLAANSPFQLAPESSGPLFFPEGNRLNLLYVISQVANGQLTIDWVYSQNIHRRETIEELAERFHNALHNFTGMRSNLAGQVGAA